MKNDASDPIIARIEHQMASSGVPETQWEAVRRALILSLHPAPLETVDDGPDIAADLLVGLAAMDVAADPSPEVRRTREGTRTFLVANNALLDDEASA